MVTDAELQDATNKAQASMDAILAQPGMEIREGYWPNQIYKSYGLNWWDGECAGCGQLSKVSPIPGCRVHDPDWEK